MLWDLQIGVETSAAQVKRGDAIADGALLLVRCRAVMTSRVVCSALGLSAGTPSFAFDHHKS
jgi:hypothetical protein